MKKRWAAVLLLLALLAGCGSPAAQNKTVLGVWREAGPGSTAAEKTQLVLRLTHSSSEQSAANDAAQAMKTRLEAVSGGTMSIEIFANDSLGSLNDAWNSFGNGTVDLRIGTADIPQQGAIMWLPLLTDTDKDTLQAACGQGGALRSLFEEYSLEKNSLVLGVLPMQYRVLASNIPVENKENMRQLTMRTIGNGGDNAYWQILCGKTKDVNVQKLALALQQKEVNACDNTLTNLVEYGTYKQVRYLTKLADRVYFDTILMNRQRMDSLTESQQQWVHDAAAYAERTISEAQPGREKAALEKITAQGVQVYELSEADQSSIRSATRDAIRQEYAQRLGQEELEKILQAAGAQTEDTEKTQEG